MPIPNASYWLREHNKLHKRIDLDADALDALYRAKLRQINKQIEAFYAKYAVDNIITVEQAKTMLTPREFSIFNNKLKYWIKDGSYSNDLSFMASLDRMVGVSKIDRLQRLETEITANLSELKQTQLISMEDSLIKTYEETENAVINVSDVEFKQTSEYKIRVVINTEFQGRRFSPRVWSERSHMTTKVKKTLMDNFVSGNNWNELNTDLKRTFGVSDYEARRLLVTETARINSVAKESSFINAGYEYYQYISVDDDRTTDICNNLDDKVFRFSEMVVGVNAPPTHVYCRSTIVPYMA